MYNTNVAPYPSQTALPQVNLTYLGRWRRLGAALIELAMVISVYGFLAGASFGLPPLFIILISLGWLAVVIANIGYLAFFYWYFGGNIGHLALGARVVNHRNGGPLSFGQAAIRAIAPILDWFGILFLINLAMVLIRSDRRHLYDLMAGTVVVYDRRASGDRWTRIAPR